MVTNYNPYSQSNFEFKDQQEYNLRIFDALGRLIVEEELNNLNAHINISALNTGTYLLVVRTENDFVGVKKIVKYRLLNR